MNRKMPFKRVDALLLKLIHAELENRRYIKSQLDYDAYLNCIANRLTVKKEGFIRITEKGIRCLLNRFDGGTFFLKNRVKIYEFLYPNHEATKTEIAKELDQLFPNSLMVAQHNRPHDFQYKRFGRYVLVSLTDSGRNFYREFLKLKSLVIKLTSKQVKN